MLAVPALSYICHQALLWGVPVTRYVWFAIAAGLAILLLSKMTELPPQSLFVEDGHIGSGHYAVAKRGASGDSLFFGPVDGSPSLEVRSQGSLSDPFIIDPSRFLVVEQSTGKTPDFRLLEIEISGASISCRRLVESKKYIGNPIVPKGPRSGDILFFSGRYNPDASGPSVSSFRMVMLRDGKVSFFSGPTFLSIGRLAQIGDQRFFATSFEIQFKDRPNVDLEHSSNLVDIRLDGTKLEATPLAVLEKPLEDVTAITSSVKAELAFIMWYEIKYGVQAYISIIQSSGYKELERVVLPKGRNYSSLFADSPSGDPLKAHILSVDEEVEGRDGVFTISEFSGKGLINERVVNLKAAMSMDTASCSAAATIF